MAKTYTVFLEGQPRALKYTFADRETIEVLFPRPDGTPGSLADMINAHLVGNGSIRVQTVILWAGLRHLGKDWTSDRVRAALIRASKERNAPSGGSMRLIFRTVIAAILTSGVLGRAADPADIQDPYQPEVEAEPESAESDDAEGPTDDSGGSAGSAGSAEGKDSGHANTRTSFGHSGNET